MDLTTVATIISAVTAVLVALAGAGRVLLSWLESRARERILREQAVKTIEAKNAEIANLEAELRERNRQIVTLTAEKARLQARLESQS